MAKQIINIGSGFNTKDGDTVRDAFNKVNQNFTDLYTLTGGSAADLTELAQDYAAAMLVNGIHNNITVSYDDATNKLNLTVPTIPVDVSDLTDTTNLLGGGGTADTGDVTFEGIKVIGAGTASGDDNGYSTLELVPDNNLYANDQYLVVDPTAPSHIHIRAGGAQDSSNAELYLGGEKNYVRVTDFNGVRLYNESSFDNTEYYLDGVHFTSAAWTAGAEGQQSTVSFTTTDQNLIDAGFNFFNDGRNILQVVTSEGTVTLTPTGFGSLGSNVWRFNVNEIPAPTPQTISEIILTIWTTRQNSLSLNSDLTVEVTDDVRITGRDTFVLRNTAIAEPIQITTSYGTNSYTWQFNADSTLTFPDNTVQTTAYTGNTTLTTAAVTGGTASVGAATAIIVTNSPNPNWTSGTGVSANGINFVIAVDGSGNATVTTINDGGTGHFVGETFGPLPGSALGGTDGVDDVFFEVTAIDLTTTTALDLTKSVNKLADGYYTLADGVEGQIMYLVRSPETISENVYVDVENADGSSPLYPFRTNLGFTTVDNTGICTLIFTDGSWKQTGGNWD